MSEDVPPGATRPPGQALTPAAVRELRMLYDSLVDIAATAAEALGKAGPGPTGLALTRFRQLDARVVAIMDRIKTILS